MDPNQFLKFLNQIRGQNNTLVTQQKQPIQVPIRSNSPQNRYCRPIGFDPLEESTLRPSPTAAASNLLPRLVDQTVTCCWSRQALTHEEVWMSTVFLVSFVQLFWLFFPPSTVRFFITFNIMIDGKDFLYSFTLFRTIFKHCKGWVLQP